MNSQSEWQCCASHLGYSLYDSLVTFFSLPLVRETTARIGFCAPFFDSHVPLRYCHIHMGHFQILGVQFPLDYSSDAIQRSRWIIGGEHRYRILLWYGSVWYCVSCRKPYIHRKTTGRTCEPLGGSCSSTNATVTQFFTLGLFSDIVVMGYSSASAQLILYSPTNWSRKEHLGPDTSSIITQMMAIWG